VRSIPIGKHVAGKVYLHISALDGHHVPRLVLEAIHEAARRAEAHFDVVSVSADQPGRVSLTSYPGFMREKFPALARAWTVDLHAGTVRVTDYTGNRPILHRKELMLLPGHPDQERFAAVTRRGEALGVFHDMAGMGNQRAWRERLREAGVRLNPTTTYSEATSLSQVPALHRLLAESGVWHRGDVNADLGGGAYDLATRFLGRRGVQNIVWDPGNREPEENARAVRRLARGATTVTLANVLNVIPDAEDRRKLLEQASRLADTTFIWIHEGDRSGRGRQTTKGWQENRITEDYLAEVLRVFPWAERLGRVIVGYSPMLIDDTSSAPG